jgi:tripartite-type tricarboxylate transporter receptor subunit TctC
VLARALAEGAEKSLGQKIVVVGKPGGGGTVATSLLKNEKPDGYTLLVNTDTVTTRAPHISDLEYDPFKDVDNFMLIGEWKTVWTSREHVQEMDRLRRLGQENPGQLTPATAPLHPFISAWWRYRERGLHCWCALCLR